VIPPYHPTIDIRIDRGYLVPKPYFPFDGTIKVSYSGADEEIPVFLLPAWVIATGPLWRSAPLSISVLCLHPHTPPIPAVDANDTISLLHCLRDALRGC
jgi:hypothetical protein